MSVIYRGEFEIDHTPSLGAILINARRIYEVCEGRSDVPSDEIRELIFNALRRAEFEVQRVRVNVDSMDSGLYHVKISARPHPEGSMLWDKFQISQEGQSLAVRHIAHGEQNADGVGGENTSIEPVQMMETLARLRDIIAELHGLSGSPVASPQDRNWAANNINVVLANVRDALHTYRRIANSTPATVSAFRLMPELHQRGRQWRSHECARTEPPTAGADMIDCARDCDAHVRMLCFTLRDLEEAFAGVPVQNDEGDPTNEVGETARRVIEELIPNGGRLNEEQARLFREHAVQGAPIAEMLGDAQATELAERIHRERAERMSPPLMPDLVRDHPDYPQEVWCRSCETLVAYATANTVDGAPLVAADCIRPDGTHGEDGADSVCPNGCTGPFTLQMRPGVIEVRALNPATMTPRQRSAPNLAAITPPDLPARNWTLYNDDGTRAGTTPFGEPLPGVDDYPNQVVCTVCHRIAVFANAQATVGPPLQAGFCIHPDGTVPVDGDYVCPRSCVGPFVLHNRMNPDPARVTFRGVRFPSI